MTKKFEKFGNLNKWPQCVIIGDKISIDQAREILSRTDTFFSGYGSNNDSWDEQVWDEIGLPIWDPSFDIDDYVKYDEAMYKFRKSHRLLDLEFLNNSYISTCFIGGVHGWCHPDGTIHFWDNIGEWPSWEDIHKDCRILAKEFTFLNIKIYLFNQEGNCEEYYDYPKECVGGFKIKNGRVYLMKKSEYLDPHAPECSASYERGKFYKLLGSGSLENYINTQKKNIFGDRADLTVFRSSCGEQFFSIDEFKEYFKI